MRNKEMNHGTKTSVSAREAARAKKIQMLCLLFIMAASCMAFPMGAYASAVSTFETKLNVIVDLAFVILRGMSILLGILAFMDLGPGITSHDTTQQMSGWKKLGGAGIMFVAPNIISFLK